VRRDPLGLLLVLVAAVAWSGSGVFIRETMAGGGFTALSLAFWRDLTTFACLLVGLALGRPRWLRVERRDLPWLAALGGIGVGTFHVLWNVAITNLGYAVATVLLYSSPAFVSVAAWLAFGEPLTRAKVLAIALALFGCVLAAGFEELTTVQLTAGGLLLGLVAAMAYGSFSLFGRRMAGRYTPWTVMCYGFGFGSLALLPFQFGRPLPGPVPAESWLWFAALVVISTVLPFSVYLMALRRLPASVASILASSEVVFGAVVGLLVYDEQLRLWQVLGAALVLAGVVLIARSGERERGT
jgi:DME family drug/metabolite transporter